MTRSNDSDTQSAYDFSNINMTVHYKLLPRNDYFSLVGFSKKTFFNFVRNINEWWVVIQENALASAY